MAEELALPEDVEHSIVLPQLDRAAPDHPHVLHRPLPPLEDRLAGGKELHLRRAGKVLQRLLGEIREWSVAAQEFDYVVHWRTSVRSVSLRAAPGAGAWGP